MPFIIASRPATADKPVEAILYEANLLGQPDRRSGVPVLIKRVSERTLLIDDDPCEIVSAIHRNGTTTFAITAGAKDLAASVRRARLQKASELAAQLTRVVTALEPGDDADAVLDQLKSVTDWINRTKQGERNERSPL